MKNFSNRLKIENLVKEFFDDLGIDHNVEIKEEKLEDIPLLYDDEGNNCNGRLSVENGELKLWPPKNNGKWPFVRPGDNIILLKDGKTIDKTIIVTEENKILIQAKQEPATSKFYLHLSEDGTEVVLETQFQHGRRYHIEDMQEEFILTVNTKNYDTIPPPAIREELIYDELKKMGVILEADGNAISRACNSKKDTKVLIVKGRPAIPPTDGQIKYMFETAERILKPREETEDNIDFYDKGDINSVEEGEVLAVLIPPVLGKEGMNVRGEIIQPPEPKTPKLLAGEGAKISDNGKKVLATINGRPKFTGKSGKISVLPQMVIRGDVDINTGHINFKGDLIIQGNVTEGFEVNALGHVYVQGGVYHGRVYSETGIKIRKNSIGGFISGGGETARYRRLLPFLERLKFILNGIANSYVQLIDNPKFSTKDLEVRGIGYFIKIILEMRFSEITKLFRAIQDMRIEEQGKQSSTIWDALHMIGKKLVGLGPLEIASLEELHKYEEFIVKAINFVEEGIDKMVDVEVGACQNVTIEATGNIMIRSTGTYHSKIHSGKSVSINGFCRGGELSAKEKVIAKEIGSMACVATFVGVDQGGFIQANRIYPNVTYSVGAVLRKNQDELSMVKIQLNQEGNLEFR